MAIDKSSRVLHNEAIWKAVSADKQACKSAKQLQFSQSSCQQQPAKRPVQQPSGKSLGCSSSAAPASGSKASSFSSHRRRVRSFEVSSPPSQLQVGGVLR